ncbi:hypothetical protein BG000_011117 [Podila horticola]|nr:hypothetical protein BG000_011117 [Podila horticola]
MTVTLSEDHSEHLRRLNVIGMPASQVQHLCSILARAKHLERLEAMNVSSQFENDDPFILAQHMIRVPHTDGTVEDSRETQR